MSQQRWVKISIKVLYPAGAGGADDALVTRAPGDELGG